MPTVLFPSKNKLKNVYEFLKLSIDQLFRPATNKKTAGKLIIFFCRKSFWRKFEAKKEKYFIIRNYEFMYEFH